MQRRGGDSRSHSLQRPKPELRSERDDRRRKDATKQAAKDQPTAAGILDLADTGISAQLDTRPDSVDFRDKMFTPTLVEVPIRIDLDEYRKAEVPVLDQKSEGACTGFGLATVANYLLRKRRVIPECVEVSPRMLYELARRYDEWPGEEYPGSSARGAMKGWHKHGVCSANLWPYVVEKPDRLLTQERMRESLRRPLGAYYRVNHKDIVALHSAIAEVGILYASATVHRGWAGVKKDGIIPQSPSRLGGHAFAVVAYDERGFWIQNSWSSSWGLNGFGLVSYDDWLENSTDVWVARLGAPIDLRARESSAISLSASAGKSEAYAFCDVRPHIVSLGNDGRLRTHGAYGTSAEDIRVIFEKAIPDITAKFGGGKRRLLLYAHGGLVDEPSAVQRVADYRSTLLEAGIYPLAFIWKTDYWTTLTYCLQDVIRRRRPEGFLDSAKDFMLDRLDDMIEPIARHFSGKAEWDQMKENALSATRSREGGVSFVLQQLGDLLRNNAGYELHVVGHSAGGIFLAPLVQMLATKGAIGSGPLQGREGMGLPITTCTLWAPACTIRLFNETYRPLIEGGAIKRFTLMTLTDDAERNDHCANVYHKSLLYLVSNAFEERFHMAGFPKHEGEPLLGMEKFVRRDGAHGGLEEFFGTTGTEWICAPNQRAEVPLHTTARRHGDFDDDGPTLRATLTRILGATEVAPKTRFAFQSSGASLRARRQRVDQAASRQPAV